MTDEHPGKDKDSLLEQLISGLVYHDEELGDLGDSLIQLLQKRSHSSFLAAEHPRPQNKHTPPPTLH